MRLLERGAKVKIKLFPNKDAYFLAFGLDTNLNVGSYSIAIVQIGNEIRSEKLSSLELLENGELK